MTLFSLLILFLSLCTVAISLTYGLLHSSRMAVGSITFTFDSPALEFDSGAKFYYNAGAVTYGSTDGSVALVLPTYNMSLDPNNQKASYYIKVEYVFSDITSGVTFKNYSYTYDTATMSSMTLVTGDDYRFASVSSGEVATGKTFDIFTYLSDLVFYGDIVGSVIDLSIIVSADTNVNFTNVHKSQTTIKTQIGINTSLQLDVSDDVKNTIISMSARKLAAYDCGECSVTSGEISTGINTLYKVEFSIPIQVASSEVTNIDYSGCYYSVVYENEISTITIATQTASSVIDLENMLGNLVNAFVKGGVICGEVTKSEDYNFQPVIKYSPGLGNDVDYRFIIPTEGWSWTFQFTKMMCCVAGDTFISTGLNGEYELAENVQVGDMVLTKDMQSGELVLNKVTKVIKVKHSDVASIKLKNGKVLRITVDHPICTTRGWVCVDHTNSSYDISPDIIEEVDLRVGDVVITNDGEVEVVSIDATGYCESIIVYNFEIENNHNYFAESVLIHNGYVICGS